MPHHAEEGRPATLGPPSPPYNVVATDMDGTLLNKHHRVSDVTKATIQKLIRKYQLPPTSAGTNRFRVFLVLASGRHVQDLAHTLKTLELPDYSGYIVSSNGAKVHCIVHHRTEGRNAEKHDEQRLEEVYAAFIPPSQLCRLLRLVSDPNEEEININIHTSDGWLCSLDWRDELRYYDSGFAYTLFSPTEKIREYESFIIAKQRGANGGSGKAPLESSFDDDPENPLRGAEKLFFGSDNVDRLQELHKVITNGERPRDAQDGAGDRNGFHLTASFSSKCCFEVTAAGVTKASSIDKLMPYLQLHSDSEGKWTLANNCIAFGDGENDSQMLRGASKGCMMANAGQRLRALLEGLPTVEEIGSNVEDGVARKLSEVFELGQVE